MPGVETNRHLSHPRADTGPLLVLQFPLQSLVNQLLVIDSHFCLSLQHRYGEPDMYGSGRNNMYGSNRSATMQVRIRMFCLFLSRRNEEKRITLAQSLSEWRRWKNSSLSAFFPFFSPLTFSILPKSEFWGN